MANAPVDHRSDNRTQVFTLARQLIVDARWMFAVAHALDHAVAFETFEAIGQRVRRNALGRLEEFCEAMLSTHEIAHDE